MRLHDESFAPGLRLSHMAARAISEKRKGDAIAAALGAVHFNPDKPESYSVLSAAYNQAHGCEEFQINAANAGLDLPVNTEDPFDTRVRATLWHNKALAENRLYRWPAAMESANKAHRLDPVNPWYLGLAANLADETADWELGRTLLTGAINVMESEGNPYNDGTPAARKFRREQYLARSIASLKLGDLPAYFRDFETRLLLAPNGGDTLAPQLFHAGMLWRPGQPIGKRVQLILEQGLGDQIEFARLAKRFREINDIESLHATCHPAVKDVIASMPWFDAVNLIPPLDVTSIASLDLVRWAFDQGHEDIFGRWEGPYVSIEGKADIQRRPATDKTAIGFCWQGNPDHVYDWARSMPIEDFLKWADSKRNVCTFHSIQHGAGECPDWVENCDRQTYAEVTQVINACDVIVGPDTGVLHLAGAMGKPAVMLHTVCRDWRWSLPYKIYGNNFHHLVQNKPGDWKELLSRLGPELDGLLSDVEFAELAAMAR